MRVKRAAKYGFCAGVRVADLKARRFAADGGRGDILGALVHNERVGCELEELGLKSVESLDDAKGPTVVFSAEPAIGGGPRAGVFARAALMRRAAAAAIKATHHKHRCTPHLVPH